MKPQVAVGRGVYSEYTVSPWSELLFTGIAKYPIR